MTFALPRVAYGFGRHADDRCARHAHTCLPQLNCQHGCSYARPAAKLWVACHTLLLASSSPHHLRAFTFCHVPPVYGTCCAPASITNRPAKQHWYAPTATPPAITPRGAFHGASSCNHNAAALRSRITWLDSCYRGAVCSVSAWLDRLRLSCTPRCYSSSLLLRVCFVKHVDDVRPDCTLCHGLTLRGFAGSSALLHAPFTAAPRLRLAALPFFTVSSAPRCCAARRCRFYSISPTSLPAQRGRAAVRATAICFYWRVYLVLRHACISSSPCYRVFYKGCAAHHLSFADTAPLVLPVRHCSDNALLSV